jgi:hypothetical protein
MARWPSRPNEMNSIAQRQPGTGRNFNLRAYVAGGAATAALIAAVIFVFGSLAAYVAFNGLPIGGEDTASGNVVVEGGFGTATNASGSAAAVASSAAAPGPGGQAAGSAGGGGANNALHNGGTAPGGTTTAGPPGTTTPDNPPATDPPATDPSGQVPDSPTEVPQTPISAPGALGGVVDDIQGAVHDAGVNVPLGQSSSGLTGPVDQVANQGLDGVGGLAGQKRSR